MHRERTHYLIADGGRARWVVRQPGETDLRTVREVQASGAHDGAHAGAAGPTGRSSPPREGAAERTRRAFAGQAAGLAAEETAAGRCNRLVLVAPSRMLPLIREQLPQTARAKVVGELARDLTKTQDHDLRRWLHEL